MKVKALAYLSIFTLLFPLLTLWILSSTVVGEQIDLPTLIWDLPTVGPPTTEVLVQGSGFDPLTAIDVYFDSTKLASTTTDKNGAFGNGVVTATGATFTRLQVPASALPGQHTITSQEHVGQKSAQKSFLVQTDWPQFGFDLPHTGLNSYENILSPATVGNLVLNWQYGDGGFNSSPAVVNGVVYVGSLGNDVYALNANSGALLWKYTTGGAVQSSPVVANGLVYVGCRDNSVYALNASTGTLLWRYTTGGAVWSSPAVASGVVYIGSLDDSVYALNASTGALLWKYTTGDKVFSSPAVAGAVVYIGSLDNSVYALNASTGTLLWRYTTGGAVWSSPAVASGVVYIGSYDNNVYALNASTGALVWDYATGSTVTSPPAVANGLVYVVPDGGIDYALDASTGSLVWKSSAAGGGPPLAVANGVVYFGGWSFNGICALDASTGAFLWAHDTQTGSSPVVANGVLYVSSSGNTLFAFGLPKQQTSPKFRPPERLDRALPARQLN